MTYDFYYDSMIASPELTFRILGVPSKDADGSAEASDVKVIVRDFIRDPISYSVVHNYSQNSGGILSAITNLKTFIESAEAKWDELKAKFKEITKQLGVGEDGGLSAAAYRQTISWIDYFKTFDYTQVNVPLNFNVRLYPKMVNGELKSVKEQVIGINDYFLSKGKSGKEDKTYTYYPPHGYSPSTTELTATSGTLTLLYGKYAVIEQLILTNYQVTFSKELIRTAPNNGELSPAYADLAITLTPSTVMTQKDIDSILSSDYNASLNIGESHGWLTKTASVRDYKTMFYDNLQYQ